MIRGYCRTNIDKYKGIEWPKKFVAIPQIGHYMESVDRKSKLKVGGITHTLTYSGTDFAEPQIEVELHHG